MTAVEIVHLSVSGAVLALSLLQTYAASKKKPAAPSVPGVVPVPVPVPVAPAAPPAHPGLDAAQQILSMVLSQHGQVGVTAALGGVLAALSHTTPAGSSAGTVASILGQLAQAAAAAAPAVQTPAPVVMAAAK